MKIAVPKQSLTGETRVALTPAVAKKLIADGMEVAIENSAGLSAHHDNAAYQSAGASIIDSNDDSLWRDANVIVTIHAPTKAQTQLLAQGQVLVGMLNPLRNTDIIGSLSARNVTTFSMELLPRITRAQTMDVLSSQANISGYKSVLLAADSGAKMYPMLITAAGTIAPSRVFVIGAGVAGLQAIATARRLGAVVEAFDVRPVVKEQVQSLGARFVELAIDAQNTQTTGGYAKELSEQQQQKQKELMAKHIIGADAVITTAAIFGKPPPMLIPNDIVRQMHHGAVIVDLAADEAVGRGNCESTRPGTRITTENGISIIGETNLPALVPVHASQVYANNMYSFLKEINHEGLVKIDLDDQIQSGAAVTHCGQVINDLVKQSMEGAG